MDPDKSPLLDSQYNQNWNRHRHLDILFWGTPLSYMKEMKELQKIVSNDYSLVNPTVKNIENKYAVVKIETRNMLIVENGLILDGSNEEI